MVQGDERKRVINGNPAFYVLEIETAGGVHKEADLLPKIVSCCESALMQAQMHLKLNRITHQGMKRRKLCDRTIGVGQLSSVNDGGRVEG